VEVKTPGKKFIRQSIIGGLNNKNKLIAPMIYTGTADTELIKYWLEHMLIPSLKENSVIILDNASIHKPKLIEKLILENGHHVIYLPPYSPELNPIERKWNQLKQLLRGFYDNTKSFIDNLCLQINNMTTPI